MTTPHPVPVSGPYDPIQQAMDDCITTMQLLSTLLQQPILMTILPREDDPAEGIWEPVQVDPWCTTCQCHHA